MVGGTARGRTLISPPGLRTRPTQDYVRESLFNIVRREVPEADVLDLFAGSGALALESLSRGARSAVLVDCAQSAMQAIRRNITQTGFLDQCLCLCCDWKTALVRLEEQGRGFDLVFLDPPYGQVDLSMVCAMLEARSLLMPDALIVAEHRTGEAVCVEGVLQVVDTRRYGDTTVTLIRRGER